MKHCMRYLFAPAFALLWLMPASGETTGQDILQKMDSVLYAAKDKKMDLTFVLTDKSGNAKERKLTAYEKGSEHRLMQFTSPADQEGIGFLSLPDDVMYLYLPAFGRARRIASHIKNKGFAGTDFSYEDLEAKKYAPRWNAELLETTKERYVLGLNPKKDTKSEYDSLVVEVGKDNHYPVHIKYYGSGGNQIKELTRTDLIHQKGYWEAKRTTMKDLRKDHSTTMVVENVAFDSGIADNVFTTRYLSRE